MIIPKKMSSLLMLGFVLPGKRKKIIKRKKEVDAAKQKRNGL